MVSKDGENCEQEWMKMVSKDGENGEQEWRKW